MQRVEWSLMYIARHEDTRDLRRNHFGCRSRLKRYRVVQSEVYVEVVKSEASRRSVILFEASRLRLSCWREIRVLMDSIW